MLSIHWVRPASLALLVLCGGTVFREVGHAQSRDTSAAGTIPTLTLSEMVSLDETFTRLAERVGRSVVAVRITRTLGSTYVRAEGREEDVILNQDLSQRVASAGSGIVLRENGYILTNEHVITQADQITVILNDGFQCPARLVARDVRSDLAVIKIDRHGLETADLGDLSRVKRGQWAFALGDPYGFAGDGQLAVSVGHVSALGRTLQRQLDPTNVRYYGNLIQTTADINPGNSGGPLLNLQGEVVGINTAIQTRGGSSEGVGFAIPISKRTRAIIDRLVRGEEVSYGYLGVHVRRPRKEDLRKAGVSLTGGALVTAVEPGTPATACRLRSGDIIVEFDTTPVESADHLVRLVGMTRIGRTVRVRYCRDGKRRSASVSIAERRVSAKPSGTAVERSSPPPGQGAA